MPRIGWGLLSPSPFCLKVEVLLRMRRDPYQLKPGLSVQRAPHGKLPWVECAGEHIPDSSLITRWLERRGDVLEESSVPPDVRARVSLVQRVVEESLYFLLLAERWKDPAVN